MRIGRNASIGTVAAGRVSGGRLGAATERGEAHAGGATAVQWRGAGRREGSVVALDLVDKRDLSAAESLTPEAENAIGAVVGGVKCAELEAMVLDVMKRAREARLWLGCDCRSEAGRRPVVAPCRNHRGTDFWRVLAGRQAAHDESCVFHRTRARRRQRGPWDRPARTAPEGRFAVLRDRAEEQRVSRPGGRSEEEEGERTGPRRPASSQLLLMLMERAGLNRLRPGDEFGDESAWSDVLLERAKEFEIAPGRLLSDLWFPAHRMWRPRLVHAREPRAARAVAAERPLDGDEAALLAALKALRLELARERGVPAYIVFPDRTLIDMARRRPRSEAEFAEVNGVGAVKLEAFAQPFLAAIDAVLSKDDAGGATRADES